MAELMAIVNLTPDSFYAPSRVAPSDAAAFLDRVRSFVAAGASILDLGAVSTRPGAVLPSLEEEWARLAPALEALRSQGAGTAEPSLRSSLPLRSACGPLPFTWPRAAMGCRTSPLHRSDSVETAGRPSLPLNSGIAPLRGEPSSFCPSRDAVPSGQPRISIDTFRAEIVRRAYEVIGDFIVNDISAGEDDPEMLPTVGRLGLEYVAMHKRGAPGTMDSMCDYPDGVMAELVRYFTDFERRAAAAGVERWILDPGLGFAKTVDQNWEILRRLPELQRFGRPILIGAADKRFTRQVPPDLLSSCAPDLLASCSPEPVCHPESVCHSEPVCHPESVCHSEPVCHPESVCHSEPVCHPERPLCHPERSEGSLSPTALGTAIAHRMALEGGAAILRVHDI